jgi:hypothetical protein
LTKIRSCEKNKHQVIGHKELSIFNLIIPHSLLKSHSFDSIIPTFYDPEDSTPGFIKSFDRKGKASTFPIMSISIGITETRARSLNDTVCTDYI